MAIKLDHEYLPGIIVNNTYWIPGRLILNLFDETAEVEWRCYFNEDARQQNVSEERLRGPIDVKVIQIPKIIYDAYLAAAVHSGEGQNIVEALYREAKEVSEPFGLKNFFSTGTNH